MFRKMAFFFVIVSCFMHIFCCGLPLLLSVASLATILGISGAEVLQISWFVGSMKAQILIISGAVLAASLIVQWFASRVDCHTDGHCTHAPCDKKKKFSERMFMVAVCLYGINLLVFFIFH